MIIRRMEEKDIPSVVTIERETFSDPWSEDSFRTEILRENNIYLVAIEDETLAGYCGLWGIAGEGQITNVAVRKENRNHGVGKRMLTELIAIGNEKGLNSYTLEVRESNEWAIRLYESLGFRGAGIRKDFYSHPKENAIIMWKQN